jgi:carboxylesterase type B
MTSVTRRAFVGASAVAASVAATVAAPAAKDSARKLQSLSTTAEPIGPAERARRKGEAPMPQHNAAALVEASPRAFHRRALVARAHHCSTDSGAGAPVVARRSFEEPSIRETLKVTRTCGRGRRREPVRLLATAP